MTEHQSGRRSRLHEGPCTLRREAHGRVGIGSYVVLLLQAGAHAFAYGGRGYQIRLGDGAWHDVYFVERGDTGVFIWEVASTTYRIAARVR